MNPLIEKWPGGICTLSGGTRTRINLNRPWQSEIVVNPLACPFKEPKDEEVVKSYELFGEQWLAMYNIYTPYSYHRLILPRKCWSASQLRSLGGEGGIKKGLLIACDLIASDQKYNVQFGAHIGALAGQNVSHFHFHLLVHQYNSTRTSWESQAGSIFQDPNLVIFEKTNLKVVAGGHRAGQCLIIPDECGIDLDYSNINHIAAVLANTIELYNVKFRSQQDLPPDYMISLWIREGKFIFGFYLPILNHWGFPDYSALLENRPITLPWPHQATVDHLLGRNPST